MFDCVIGGMFLSFLICKIVITIHLFLIYAMRTLHPLVLKCSKELEPRKGRRKGQLSWLQSSGVVVSPL